MATPFLQPLIDQLREVWRSETDVEQRMRKAKPLMEQLVTNPEMQQHSRAWPMTPGQNLLFYEDPDYGFALNATVRKQGTPATPHDHAHTWTLYCIIEGTESMEHYERLDDGSREGYAELKRTSVSTGTGGSVDLIEPYAIHTERAGPERSSAIILRSERLVGKTTQRMFNPEKNTVSEAYGPQQVPYTF
jgi:predicted metal-dependent enzyme (double-stranded beta helix superfamily)